jgi:preprotein translocase subunit YajC
LYPYCRIRGVTQAFVPLWAIILESFTVFISTAYAQTAAAAPASASSSLVTMLPFVLMFVVMYFVMIRPQMKKQKETRAMLDALAKGDPVVTAGGLIGTVTQLDDNYVTVQAAQGVELKFQRTAITMILPKTAK